MLDLPILSGSFVVTCKIIRELGKFSYKEWCVVREGYPPIFPNKIINRFLCSI